MGDGKRLAVGVAKSCLFVEGPRGRGCANVGLVIDAKKAAMAATELNGQLRRWATAI